MRHRLTKGTGVLAALSLLASPAARAAEDCRAWRENGVHIEPILLSGVERGRDAPLVQGAVLGEEVVQIATRGWMLGADLRLPAPDGLAYPAGTPLEPSYIAPARLCLPHAPVAADGAADDRRSRGRARQACLEDADGDGLHERVDLYAVNSALHVPQARVYRSVTLPVPVRLAENPLGFPGSRRQVLRRIEIDPVREGTAQLIVQHAFRNLDRGGDRGRFEADGQGGLVYRPPAPAPVPIDRRDSDWRRSDAETRTIPLADGEVVVGGLRLRILRRSNGWTITPLADRYPRWIHFGCGGRSLSLGVAPRE